MFFMYLMGETPRKNPVNMDQRNNIKKSWWQKLMVLFFSTSPLICHRASRSGTWEPTRGEDLCPLISGSWCLGGPETQLKKKTCVFSCLEPIPWWWGGPGRHQYDPVHIVSGTPMYWGVAGCCIPAISSSVLIKHSHWMELATEISDNHYTTEPQHTVWVIVK